MRCRLALTLLGLAVAGPALAQEPETRYWPLREINFPVPVEKFTGAAQKPSKLRFSVRPEGQSWKEVDARAPDDLDLTNSEEGKRGFRYVSPSDGTYDFCLQLEYPNGDRSPRDAARSAQYRIVFDTKPPAVRAAKLGRTGIEWDVSDENLKPDGIEIQARWPDEANSRFKTVTRRDFKPKPRDLYTWTTLKPGESLEVRILARDKANNETASPPIRIPSATAGEGLGGALAGNPGRDPLAGGGGSGGGGGPAQKVEFSNTRELIITSKLAKVTRSGVVKSHLFVRTPTTNWARAEPGEKAEQIVAGENKEITWNYAVKGDGQYGFIVVPENAAGGRDPDPEPADPAQFLITVDTVDPVVSDVAAVVKPGARGNPKVEITWNARDENLESLPILVEYGIAPAGPWKPISPGGGKIANSGSTTWDITDDIKEWKFWIKVSATDLAKRTGSKSLDPDKPVIVDTDTPKARIEKVTGNPSGRTSGGPAGAPVVPTAGGGEPARFPVPAPQAEAPKIEPPKPTSPAAPSPLPEPRPPATPAPAGPPKPGEMPKPVGTAPNSTGGPGVPIPPPPKPDQPVTIPLPEPLPAPGG